jgi:cytochrome c oxidase subunit 2
MAARSALLKAAWALLGVLGSVAPAMAQGAEAALPSYPPRDWEIWHQVAVTPIMRNMEHFSLFLLIVASLITLLVLFLLLYSIVRFNAKRHPTPSRTTHNTVIEVLWTVLPVLILVIIAIPSFRLLYAEDRIPHADMTVKATGNQWYWSYEYPDNGDISFDSMMVEDADLKPGQPRLLTADRPLVVPVDATVRVIVTGSDVIHSFAVPPFGIKIDAVPGRLNETWFRAEKVGIYYGECSELCGARHALMPIEVKVVPKADFDAWVAEQKKSAKADTPAPTRVANAAVAR